MGNSVAPLLPLEGPKLQELDKNLYPKKAMEAKDVTILKQRAADDKVRLAIDRAVEIFVTHAKSKKQSYSAPGFRRFRMAHPQQRIEELLKHKEYAEPVMKLLQKQHDKKLGVVVSFLTCTNMNVGSEGGKELEVGMQGKVPGGAAGAPGANPALNVASKRTRHVEIRGEYENEVILACSYLQLELHPPETGLWGLFKRTFYKEPIGNIEVSAEYLRPDTGGLFVSSEPIEGDLRRVLGQNGNHTQNQHANEDEIETEEADDLAFIVYT